MATRNATTQTTHPWRAVVRTLFAIVTALAAMAPMIYEAITQADPGSATGWAATALGIAGAITRVLALPVVEEFLEQFLPFLAAKPKDEDVPVLEPEPEPVERTLGD